MSLIKLPHVSHLIASVYTWFRFRYFDIKVTKNEYKTSVPHCIKSAIWVKNWSWPILRGRWLSRKFLIISLEGNESQLVVLHIRFVSGHIILLRKHHATEVPSLKTPGVVVDRYGF